MTDSAFKFKLQEEKYNQVQKSTLQNITSKAIAKHFDIDKVPLSNNTQYFGYTGAMSGLLNNFGNTLKVNNQNDTMNLNKESERQLKVDYSNEGVKLLIQRYQKEIKDLKGYINKINDEIRKSVYADEITFPDLSSYLSSGTKTSEINYLSDELIDFFNSTVDRMIDPSYSNPLFTLYEKQIKELNNEIDLLKEKLKSCDKEINCLVNENSFLRKESYNLRQEIERIVSYRVLNENNKIAYDYEFIKTLEERLSLLSRENEILSANYQLITKEYCQFKMEVNNMYKEYSEKVQYFNKIFNELKEKNDLIEQMNSRLTITENKVFYNIDEINTLTSIKDQQSIEIQRLINELDMVKERCSLYQRELEVYDKK